MKRVPTDKNSILDTNAIWDSLFGRNSGSLEHGINQVSERALKELCSHYGHVMQGFDMNNLPEGFIVYKNSIGRGQVQFILDFDADAPKLEATPLTPILKEAELLLYASAMIREPSIDCLRLSTDELRSIFGILLLGSAMV